MIIGSFNLKLFDIILFITFLMDLVCLNFFKYSIFFLVPWNFQNAFLFIKDVFSWECRWDEIGIWHTHIAGRGCRTHTPLFRWTFLRKLAGNSVIKTACPGRQLPLVSGWRLGARWARWARRSSFGQDPDCQIQIQGPDPDPVSRSVTVSVATCERFIPAVINQRETNALLTRELWFCKWCEVGFPLKKKTVFGREEVQSLDCFIIATVPACYLVSCVFEPGHLIAV